jgi:hypothetical protein
MVGQHGDRVDPDIVEGLGPGHYADEPTVHLRAGPQKIAGLDRLGGDLDQRIGWNVAEFSSHDTQ